VKRRTHIGSHGASACGASYLLDHDTTTEVLHSNCLKCITVVLGQMLAQADVMANQLRSVAEDEIAMLCNLTVSVPS
jgi:hypothetical protein